MNFNELPNGMVEGFVLLKKCDEKKTKSGSIYLDVIICDKDGEMSGKWWDYQPNGIFSADMIVKIRGNLEQYNGRDQFRISQMRPISCQAQKSAVHSFLICSTKGLRRLGMRI